MADPIPTPPVTAKAVADQLRAALQRHLDMVTSTQQAAAALRAGERASQLIPGQAGALRRS